jgi:hypothetical protein
MMTALAMKFSSRETGDPGLFLSIPPQEFRGALQNKGAKRQSNIARILKIISKFVLFIKLKALDGYFEWRRTGDTSAKRFPEK